MACAACKITKKGCKDDCCFAEFFPPQDTEMFQKLKLHFSVKFMREELNNDKNTKEYKKKLVQGWKDSVNDKGKEKQAGSSSSKNEKKELQALKCQVSSSNELGCKDTCLFVDLFPPKAKEIIVKIKNQQGMEMVKTEVKLMLEKLIRKTDNEEKLSRKTDDKEKLATQILLELNQGDL